MPSIVEFELGPSGDFATWADAMAAMVARTPVTSDEMVYLNVAQNITLGNSTTDRANANTDPTRHIVVRPKSGLGWRDLNPGATSRPATGISLTLNAGAGGSLISSNGFVFEGFLIECTGTTSGKPGLNLGTTASGGKFGGARYNWIRCDTTNTYGVLVSKAQETSGTALINVDRYFFEDNFVEAINNTGTEPLVTAGAPLCQRNTLRGAGGTGRLLRVAATVGGATLRNNTGQGELVVAHGTNTNMHADTRALSGNNYITGAWTRTGTGNTYDPGTITAGISTAAWDAGTYRPASGGVLIGAADATANFSLDMLGQNRGNIPDAGAIQRDGGTPLPTGSITSQTVSGQVVTVQGTHSGATGGELRLDGPTYIEEPIVIAGGNWSVSVEASAGTYSVEVELTNDGGPFSLFGSAVVIDGYTGDPEGPEPTEPTEPPVVGNVEGVPATPTTATINADTTRSGGTMWVVVTGSATTPTKVQIKAGQNHLGADAGTGRKLSQAVGAPGTRSLSASSLTAEATYYAHAYHEHPDGDSNVGSSAAFTQPAVVVPAEITVHPASQTVDGGDDVTFSVTATGTAPISYQWRRDGANISGATSASYTLTGATIYDSGAVFTCFVSNAGGTDLSNGATLTVDAPVVDPTITQEPEDATVTAGQSASFFVEAASGGGTLVYRWYVRPVGDAGAGTEISGAVTDLYTTPPLALIQSGQQYQCRVSNETTVIVSSRWASVTVVEPEEPEPEDPGTPSAMSVSDWYWSLRRRCAA